MVSYKKLWKLLIDKGLNKRKLMQLTQISPSSMSKLTKGQNVTTDILCKICDKLNCDFGDIMEYEKDMKYSDFEDELHIREVENMRK